MITMKVNCSIDYRGHVIYGPLMIGCVLAQDHKSLDSTNQNNYRI